MEITKKNQELVNRIIKDLETKLSKKRFNHVLSVYNEALDLCSIYHIDVNKVAISSILHDINKENNLQDEEKIIKKFINTGDFSKDLIKIPNAWHGYTASIYIQEKYNIRDQDIIEAVRFHTLGHPMMNDIAKIVYIADFIEPTRKLENLSYYRSLKGIPLNELLFIIHHDNLKYLASKNYYIAKQSQELENKLKNSL